MARNLFEVVARRGDEVAQALPEDVTITFEIEGSGGGVWTLAHDASGVRVVAEPPGPNGSDCRVRCTVEDLRSLLRGELDGRHGFLTGRLRLEGDVGLALRLQEALARPGVAASGA